MFGIGWSEFVVIGVVALIAIGPKELPGVLRMVGQSIGKIRRMANEFQGQFQEAMREAEMADVRKELDEIGASAASVTNYDPVAEANKEMESAFTEKPAETPAADASPPLPEPAPPVTNPDFASPAPEPAREDARDLLPPGPKVEGAA
jgi:sec-independent protein translocase protein TatB